MFECRLCGCTELAPCVDRHDGDPHPCEPIAPAVCSACRYTPLAVRLPQRDEILANYPGLVLTRRGSLVCVTDLRRFDE